MVIQKLNLLESKSNLSFFFQKNFFNLTLTENSAKINAFQNNIRNGSV